MKRYQLATKLRLSVVFTDQIAADPEDPTAVTLYVMDPLEVVTPYTAGAITRDGVGLYHMDFTPDQTGDWRYKWQGTGALVVTSPDTMFAVDPSSVLNPWP